MTCIMNFGQFRRTRSLNVGALRSHCVRPRRDDSIANCIRQLRSETGLVAGSLTGLGAKAPAPAIATTRPFGPRIHAPAIYLNPNQPGRSPGLSETVWGEVL
jgi:hypothetical protein